MTAAVAGADDERKAQAIVRDDAPRLLAALKEMKDGLDLVGGSEPRSSRSPARYPLAGSPPAGIGNDEGMVRKNQLPTGDGIGCLEAKHHLLLSYCQGLVYYLLRKAKGLPVDGHPVVRSLVEIRLFLEKISPIDKKMEYQIQKLTNAADDNVKGRQQGDDDLLGYRPNLDMMDIKIAPEGQGKDGVYVPPRIGPAAMDDNHSKDAIRKKRRLLRMATENPYFKEMTDDDADRPEEWKETAGDESKEFMTYMRQREKKEKAEEELFTRAPVTKREKLQGLTDGFDLGMNMLLDGEKEDDGGSSEPRSKSGGRRKHQKGGKRKRH
ncbi:hypothetical protein VPH35_062425 [Triticum aestivum]